MKFVDSLTLSSSLNLTICLLVLLFGYHWATYFRREYKVKYRFVFGAYVCWLLSWAVWVVAWAVISSSPDRELSARALLIFWSSDLNAICLVVLYRFLTRGREYNWKQARIDFAYLVLVSFLGGAVFYYGMRGVEFVQLQKGWSLCLSVASTVLVGWAFKLRYQTKVVLVVGFVYALMQPALFEAVLIDKGRPHVLEAVIFCAALLKIVWASVVTLYFSGTPETAKSMVESFPPEARLSASWPLTWWVQTGSLVAVAIILVAGFYPPIFKDSITPVVVTISASAGLLWTLIATVKWFKERGDADKTNEDPGPKREG